MTEAGWLNIATTIVGGIVTTLTAWIALQNAKLSKKVETVTTATNDMATQVASMSEKTDSVAKTTDETQVKVTENLQRLDGRLTLLLEETRKNAFQEGKAAGMAESRIIAKDLLKENVYKEVAVTIEGEPLVLPASVTISEDEPKK